MWLKPDCLLSPPIVDYDILGSKESGYITPIFWASLKIEELI